jgi:hypothetical protein
LVRPRAAWAWALAPLIDGARGDFIHFPMTFSGAEYARDVLADIAQRQGLICYDPQIGQLLPAPDDTPLAEIHARVVPAIQAFHGELLARSNRVGRTRRVSGRG